MGKEDYMDDKQIIDLFVITSYSIHYTKLYEYIVLNSTASNKEKANALFLYGLQLVINFLWPLIFFKFELVFLGFLWILLLLAVVAFMIVSFYKINPLSAYLQIPYFLWLLFAAYLNIGIYVLNK